MDLRRAGLLFVRYGIAAIAVIVGIVFAARGGDNSLEGGSLFVGAGIAILLLNALFRYGVTGDTERQKEEDARRFFDEHGHWPDEPGPGHEATRERATEEPVPEREPDPSRPRRGPGPPFARR
ncbi:MAG: hypothetical protein ACJ76V_03225 [Thermoleophilaceae bacterium]